MPRAPSITQADVNAICDRLTAAGVRPGVRRIIEEHGSGSQGTVYPMFKTWQSGQAHPVETAAALSPVLQRALLEFVNRETAQAKANLEAQLAESEQMTGDLARENERQAIELEEQAEAHSKLLDGLASLQGRVDQLTKDLADAHDETARERAGAEQARTDLAVAILRLESMPRLESELEALKEECDLERRARAMSQQEAAVATAQRDDKAERLAEEKARSTELAGKLDQETANAKRLTSELNTLNVRVEATNSRLESAARELETARESAKEARAESRRAFEELAEMREANKNR